MTILETVQGIYQAFGRGDVPWILERVRDDVDWEAGDAEGGHGVPWLAPGKGRAHVASFFQVVASNLAFSRFVPTAFFTAGDTVLALVDLEGKVTATGQVIRECDEVHIWRFDDKGRVRAFRHRVDTAQHVRASGR